MWIDSHCHLTHENILPLGGPDAIMAAARTAGVAGALTINCRIADEFPEILKVAQAIPDVWCTVGTHPHEASVPAEKAITIDQLVTLANSDPNIVGIGESGLDYFYDYGERTDQQECFRKHIRACIATGLPLVVHARDADDDILQILREEGAAAGGPLRGVMHCFSSTRKLAEGALDLGFYISFSGIISFKKAQDLRDIARDVPLDRILVETDSPYLAPEPYRGQVNQPAYVVRTGQVLAEIKKLDEKDIANHSYNNFFSLFNRAKPVR